MKRLVVCADGTWNRRDRDMPTNVEKIAQAILPAAADGTVQVVFYDEGVGTNRGLDRFIGGAFGYGLSRNVGDGYRFLVDNYVSGDEIYLFGFSRGAFTVRSLAGLIRKCDLLTKANAHLFPEAYDIYCRRDDGADSDDATAFREQYAAPAKITCLGVWDTVGSLGVPGYFGATWLGGLVNRNYQFHDVKISSKVVKAAYQALAIDEVRKAFAPAIWWREQLPTQPLEQAWFPGCHRDVGGGAMRRTDALGGCLSDVTLKWMIERAMRHGLEFDTDYLSAALHPDPFAPIHQSRTGFYLLSRPCPRQIGELPDDPALQRAIERRRQEHPGENPVQYPPPLESPQAVHESATERIAANVSYRPRNLMAYLNQ